MHDGSRKTDQDLINAAMPAVIRVHANLLQAYQTVTDRAVGLLMLSNGMGLVALFTFMYSQQFKGVKEFYTPLGMFIVGFLFVTTIAAADFLICKDYLNTFITNFNKFKNGDMALESLFNLSKHACVFRPDPDTNSGNIRTVIPVSSGH